MRLTIQTAQNASSPAPVITPEQPSITPVEDPDRGPAEPAKPLPHPLTRPPGIRPNENPRPKAAGGLAL